LLSLMGDVTLDDIQRRFADSADVMTHANDLRRYFDCLEDSAFSIG
jgi:hypothetical protein